MTLLIVKDSNGVVGRCDARCYDAKQERCRCVCGGRNHGKGLATAIEVTSKMVLEEFKTEELSASATGDLIVSRRPIQRNLF